VASLTDAGPSGARKHELGIDRPAAIVNLQKVARLRRLGGSALWIEIGVMVSQFLDRGA
jgi:hypothetical protein